MEAITLPDRRTRTSRIETKLDSFEDRLNSFERWTALHRRIARIGMALGVVAVIFYAGIGLAAIV